LDLLNLVLNGLPALVIFALKSLSGFLNCQTKLLVLPHEEGFQSRHLTFPTSACAFHVVFAFVAYNKNTRVPRNRVLRN